MFEGMNALLSYALEMGLEDETMILTAQIGMWEKSDDYAKRKMYEIARQLMRGHAFPTRPRCKIDELLMEIKPIAIAAFKLHFDGINEFMLGHKRHHPPFKKVTLHEYQENEWGVMRRKIRDMVNQGHFTLERNKDGKVVLTDIREEE